MNKKRGQSSGTGAAGLVGIIALLIIFYILFLPPEDRAELLGEEYQGGSTISAGTGGTSGSGGSTTNQKETETVLSTSPGRIDYQNLDEFEYDLSSFTIFKETNAQKIDAINDFYIKRGVFDVKNHNTTFFIEDLENTDNVLMSFTTKKHKGILGIELNGKSIYNNKVTTVSPNPVNLKRSLLNEGENSLAFYVSGVGYKFWSTNEYSFEGISILAEITDTSKQESKNTFYISEEEYRNMERATLKFIPECNPTQVGTLDVILNGEILFSGVPDCGILNRHYITPRTLSVGRNKVSFRTNSGSYLVDRIQVKTELDAPIKPTFYFELDEDLFSDEAEFEDRCGDVDGICPEDCDEDIDKDCCFDTYVNAYWCDIKTANSGDRCVGYVNENFCDRCKSGYESESGKPPEECEDICGDDTDNECPSGCNIAYDEDCCFDKPGDQFWCEDLPISGQDYICVNSVTYDNCDNCPKGYDGEDKDPICNKEPTGTEEGLKSGVDVILTIEFTEAKETKEADIWINGRRTGFDTREESWDKNINDYVESGSNSIMVDPQTVLEVREITVDVEE